VPDDTTTTATEDQPDVPGTALEPAERIAPQPVDPTKVAALPGAVRPHPTPAKYVVIALVLVIITAAEVGVYYLEGEVPDGVIIAFLLTFALIKLTLVASWYMHLRTDQPIFRRFFVIGVVAAIALYMIALTTLHVFSR
jgi:caa(3)-type oxidase subunit IV